MWLQCRAQEYSEDHGTFMYIIYDICILYTICSIYLLTCNTVGPLEDACAWLGGSPRKRQRVDSDGETHLKKLRAWANEWPTQERLVGTLEVFYDSLPWRTRIQPMGAGSLVFGPSSAVSTHKKLRWQNKILFTGTALERLNLGRCP